MLLLLQNSIALVISVKKFKSPYRCCVCVVTCEAVSVSHHFDPAYFTKALSVMQYLLIGDARHSRCINVTCRFSMLYAALASPL